MMLRYKTENKFSSIRKQAKAEDADIFRGDGTGIRNDESKGRCYSPKGKRHVQKVNPVPGKINMVNAVSNQGKVHFMFYKDTMTVQKLLDFYGTYHSQ